MGLAAAAVEHRSRQGAGSQCAPQPGDEIVGGQGVDRHRNLRLRPALQGCGNARQRAAPGRTGLVVDQRDAQVPIGPAMPLAGHHYCFHLAGQPAPGMAQQRLAMQAQPGLVTTAQTAAPATGEDQADWQRPVHVSVA